jgi:hypothetical protein
MMCYRSLRRRRWRQWKRRGPEVLATSARHSHQVILDRLRGRAATLAVNLDDDVLLVVVMLSGVTVIRVALGKRNWRRRVLSHGNFVSIIFIELVGLRQFIQAYRKLRLNLWQFWLADVLGDVGSIHVKAYGRLLWQSVGLRC